MSWFADKIDQGNSILRPIHYPPISSPDVPNVRAGGDDSHEVALGERR